MLSACLVFRRYLQKQFFSLKFNIVLVLILFICIYLGGDILALGALKIIIYGK